MRSWTVLCQDDEPRDGQISVLFRDTEESNERVESSCLGTGWGGAMEGRDRSRGLWPVSTSLLASFTVENYVHEYKFQSIR